MASIAACAYTAGTVGTKCNYNLGAFAKDGSSLTQQQQLDGTMQDVCTAQCNTLPTFFTVYAQHRTEQVSMPALTIKCCLH